MSTYGKGLIWDPGAVWRVEQPMVVMTKNLVITPAGHFAAKYLRGRKYFFDGQIWGWK